MNLSESAMPLFLCLAGRLNAFPRWLNSNKGTKRDRPFRLSPLIDWIFGLWATPKMSPHLVYQFWGSNSDAVSQLLVRDVTLDEQGEVLPGNRRAMGHRVEKRLPAGGIFDLF